MCNYSGNSVLLFFSPFPFTLLLRENLNTEESDVITHIWDLLLKWHIASAALILLHSRQHSKRKDETWSKISHMKFCIYFLLQRLGNDDSRISFILYASFYLFSLLCINF